MTPEDRAFVESGPFVRSHRDDATVSDNWLFEVTFWQNDWTYLGIEDVAIGKLEAEPDWYVFGGTASDKLAGPFPSAQAAFVTLKLTS